MNPRRPSYLGHTDHLAILEAGGDTTVLIAHDLTSGTTAWTARLPGEGTVGNQYLTGGDAIVASVRGGGIVSLDPTTGTTRWHQKENQLLAVVGNSAVTAPHDAADEVALNKVRITHVASGANTTLSMSSDVSQFYTWRSGGDALSVEVYVGGERDTLILHPGSGKLLIRRAGQLSALGATRTGKPLAVAKVATGYVDPVMVVLMGDPMTATEASLAQELSPVRVENGVVWCESKTEGTVVPADPSGRSLAAPVPGTVHSVSARVLCVKRDGGASPYDIYRIEEI